MDGRGIEPDVQVNDEIGGSILNGLYAKGLFFKFTNTYVLEHINIASPSEFKLTEDEYNKFVQFVEQHELEYTTETEQEINRLKKIAERENYLQFAEEEILAIEKKLLPDQSKDLVRFKDQIKTVLENEIVSRYYKQSGRVESLLIDDPAVHEAFESLKPENQQSILGTKG